MTLAKSENTRDVLSRYPGSDPFFGSDRASDPDRAPRAGKPRELPTRKDGGVRGQEAPLCRVGRSMNLRKQVEPLKQAALQASSHRGMHTTRHRDSLG